MPDLDAIEQKRRVWERMYRGILIDGHVADHTWQLGMGDPPIFSAIDVPKMVRQLKDANVQYVYFDAIAIGGTFYNSEIYPQYKHPALGDYDFFGDFVQECDKQGILPCGYLLMNFYFTGRMAVENPNWRQKHPDGQDITQQRGNLTQPMYHVCINSSGREFYLTCAREITEKYDLAAYWLDGIEVPNCFCDHCRDRFKADTGLDMPLSEDGLHMKELRKWRHCIVDEYCRELKEVIHSVRPEALVARNFWGGFWVGRRSNREWELFDPETNADTQDFISHETGGGNAVCSIWPRMLRAMAGDDKAVEMEVWRYNYPQPVGTQQIKSVPWLLAEMCSVIANGAKIQLYDNMYPDGTLEPVMIERVGTAYRYIEQCEPWLRGAEPVPYVGVFWSKHARELHATEGVARKPFLGVCQGLLRSQIPFGGLTNRGITPNALKKFSVVILPDINCMTEEEADAIRSYVANGGGLIVTFETSLYDLEGKRRQDFLLADVLGVRYVGDALTLNSFLKVTENHPVTEGIDKRMTLASQNNQQIVVQCETAKALGKLLYSYRNTYGAPPSHEETGYGGLFVNQYGHGRVVYFPGDLGTIYYDYGQPEYRRLLINAIRWVEGSAAPVVVEAPTSVEVTIYKQELKDRLIVHLVNFQSQTGRVYAPLPAANRWIGSHIEDVLPVYDLLLRILIPNGKRPGRVYEAPKGTTLEYCQDGRYIEVMIPKLDIHTMIAIELI
jgi:type 1 glutamine amidotransferase